MCAKSTPSRFPTSSPPTVLVVDDDPAIRELMVDTLVSAGYWAAGAEDGAQALQLAAETEVIDLLLTDWVMPGMDGVELARRMRLARPEVRVLVVTGYFTAPEIAGTLPFPVLLKPFSPQNLTEAVQAALAPPRQAPTVVVADDDPQVRRFLASVLRADGCEVVEAASGREAMQLISQGGVQVLLLDLVMPEGDGLDLIRRLRSFKAPVRILAMSGRNDEYLAAAQQLGADRALSKPVHPAALQGAVRQLLEGLQDRCPPGDAKTEKGKRPHVAG